MVVVQELQCCDLLHFVYAVGIMMAWLDLYVNY
jgi:hypothetical protein